MKVGNSIGLVFLATLLGWSAYARGDDLLPPHDAVEKARLSRFNFDDVILDIRRAIPFMAGKAQVESYIGVLEELKQIELDLNYSIFDVSPLESMATMLTKADIQYVSMLDDPENILRPFVHWSNDATRLELRHKEEARLDRASTRERLLFGVERVRLCMQWLSDPDANAESSTIAEFDQLQGIMVGLMIRDHFPEVSVSDLSRYLSGLHWVDALNPAMDQLQTQVATVGKNEDLVRAIEFAVALKRSMDAFASPPAYGASIRPGSIASDALQRLIELGGTLNETDTTQVLALSDGTAVINLSTRLATMSADNIPAAQWPFLLHLAQGLTPRLATSHMDPELKKLRAFEGELNMALILRDAHAEGVYQVQSSTGGWQMSLARMGSTNLAVCFQIKYNEFPVAFSMTYAQMNPDNGMFHVSGVDVNQSPITEGTDVFIDFKIDPVTHTLTGVFSRAAGTVPFKATLLHPFTDYWTNGGGTAGALVGTYGGELLRKRARLAIRETGTSLTAALIFEDYGNPDLDIPLGVAAFDERFGNFIFTQRDNDNGVFLQVRGQLIGGGIRGEYIIGDRAESIPFVMARVSP